MGHQRLGEVPKTQRWSKVVATVASVVGEGSTLSESTALVADRTLDAAAPALQRATEDTGLSYTFYLLTQIALASVRKTGEEDLNKSVSTLMTIRRCSS